MLRADTSIGWTDDADGDVLACPSCATVGAIFDGETVVPE